MTIPSGGWTLEAELPDPGRLGRRGEYDGTPGFPFDDVISVAAAGSFKPHVATYRTACELTGLAPREVLFVANHEFDCVDAKAYGTPS